MKVGYARVSNSYEGIDLIIVDEIDRILIINQLDQITVEVVEAARDSLVIGI